MTPGRLGAKAGITVGDVPTHGVRLEAPRHARRVIPLLVVLVVVLLIAATAGLHAVLEAAAARGAALIDRHPVGGAVLFGLLAAVSAMVAFFSSAIVIPIGVYQWGTAWTAALLLAGWLLGGIASYLLGKSVATPILGRLLGGERLSFYQERIKGRASLGTILLFQLAAPAEISGYALGAARYPLPLFVLTRAVGELPYAIGAAFLGEGLLQRRYWLIVAVGTLATVFLAWSFARLHHDLRLKPDGGRNRTAQPGR